MLPVIFILDNQTPVLDRTPDGQQKLIEFHRLQKKIQRTAFHQIDGKRSFILRGKKDDFDPIIFPLDDVEKFGARAMRHAEIENAGIRLKGIYLSGGFERVR